LKLVPRFEGQFLINFCTKSKSKTELWHSLRSYFSKAKAPKFAPIRDALYLPFKIERELVIREKARAKF
jgi:hypothetical protein